MPFITITTSISLAKFSSTNLDSLLSKAARGDFPDPERAKHQTSVIFCLVQQSRFGVCAVSESLKQGFSLTAKISDLQIPIFPQRGPGLAPARSQIMPLITSRDLMMRFTATFFVQVGRQLLSQLSKSLKFPNPNQSETVWIFRLKCPLKMEKRWNQCRSKPLQMSQKIKLLSTDETWEV